MPKTSKTDTQKIRLTLGPIARELLREVPATDRMAALDELLDQKLDQVTERTETAVPAETTTWLISAMKDVYKVVEQLSNQMHERFDQQLDEHVMNRGLLGTLVTEDDERAAIIEDIQQQSADRQLGIDALKKQMRITITARRQRLSELMPVIVPEGTHEQAQADLDQRERGGIER